MSKNTWPDLEKDLVDISERIHALRLKVRFGPEYLNQSYDLGLLDAARMIIECEIDTDAESWKAIVKRRFDDELRCVMDMPRSEGS